MTYQEPLHVLPYFEGDQHIAHKIELSPHSRYIIKTNKNEMIQTETKIHRHELSVALAKATLFQCYKTHFLLLTEMMEERGRLHRCHSQHKSLLLT